MPTEILYLIILTGASILFITDWMGMEVTALLILVSLAITELLTPAQAFSGFANSATITVAAMFILSEGLVRTGALENATLYLTQFSRGNPRRLLIFLGLTVPFISAIINNTPVVVMMVPVIVSISLQHGLSPSKFLIPVSYFAILGGTLTLIGTSTNILVNELNIAAGHAAIPFFAFAPLGIIFVITGGIVIVWLSDRFLPDRLGPLEGEPNSTRLYTAQLRIPQGSALIGRSVDEAFRNVQAPTSLHRRISGIRRLAPDQPDIPPTDLKLLAIRHVQASDPLVFHAESKFQLHDLLLVSGSADHITRFKSRYTLTPHVDEHRPETQEHEVDPERVTVQAVLLSNSPLIGHPVRDLGEFEPGQISVVGLLSLGPESNPSLSAREMHSGDAILLEGSRAALRRMRSLYRVIFIEGQERIGSQFQRNRWAILIMAAVIALSAFTQVPIVLLALSGVLAMIFAKCLSVEEAFKALNSRTLMLLAGTIPLGIAMDTSGVSHLIVNFLLSGPLLSSLTMAVSALYLLTSVLTQLISNAAVAVLLVPIAVGIAQSMGVATDPLIMAIAFGASASFMSPTGYQTNAIVMGPGGYTFSDYMRLGVPLQVLMWALATLFIPRLYA